jgi:hypothetical protein
MMCQEEKIQSPATMAPIPKDYLHRKHPIRIKQNDAFV